MPKDQTLRAHLVKWRFLDGCGLLNRAAASGSTGAELLAEQLRSRRNGYDRDLIAAALGNATGDAGIDELRAATRTRGPQTRGLKHASLIALTKRLQEGATPDLIVALRDRDREVRQSAVTCLLMYGDDSAFDAVLADTLYLTRRTNRSDAIEGCIATDIAYLARVGSPWQLQRLEEALEPYWSGLSDRRRHPIWPSNEHGEENDRPPRIADLQRYAEQRRANVRRLFAMKLPE